MSKKVEQDKKFCVNLEKSIYTEVLIQAKDWKEAEKKAEEMIEKTKRYENYKIAGIEEIKDKKEEEEE